MNCRSVALIQIRKENKVTSKFKWKGLNLLIIPILNLNSISHRVLDIEHIKIHNIQSKSKDMYYAQEEWRSTCPQMTQGAAFKSTFERQLKTIEEQGYVTRADTWLTVPSVYSNFKLLGSPAARQNMWTMIAYGFEEFTWLRKFWAIWMHSRRSSGEMNSSKAESFRFMSAIRIMVALKRKCLGL